MTYIALLSTIGGQELDFDYRYFPRLGFFISPNLDSIENKLGRNGDTALSKTVLKVDFEDLDERLKKIEDEESKKLIYDPPGPVGEHDYIDIGYLFSRNQGRSLLSEIYGVLVYKNGIAESQGDISLLKEIHNQLGMIDETHIREELKKFKCFEHRRASDNTIGQYISLLGQVRKNLGNVVEGEYSKSLSNLLKKGLL